MYFTNIHRIVRRNLSFSRNCDIFLVLRLKNRSTFLYVVQIAGDSRRAKQNHFITVPMSAFTLFIAEMNYDIKYLSPFGDV